MKAQARLFQYSCAWSFHLPGYLWQEMKRMFTGTNFPSASIAKVITTALFPVAESLGHKFLLPEFLSAPHSMGHLGPEE